MYAEPLISWPSELTVFDAVAHAVGVLALQQSNYEASLEGLLAQYLDVPIAARAYLFDALHNAGRTELIRILVSSKEPDEGIRDAIQYCLKHFDVCAENRNLIAHARVSEICEHDVVMLKAKASDPCSLTVYAFEPGHIRAAAAAAREGTVYAHNLMLRWTASLQPDAGPIPLPDKPQKPRKLDLCRP